jgi:stage V sporulation protein SpoVS
MAQGRLVRLALLSPLAALAVACQGANTPIYFNGPTGDAVLTAMGGEQLPPHNGLTLRFRNPTQKESDALARERDERGYDADIPWVSRDKVHIELSYVVKNLSDHDGVFNLMVNGATEYTKYDMDVVAMALGERADEVGALFPLMESKPQTVPAGGSHSGVIREDDFFEAELDTDALGRWLADDTFAGVLINRSEVNPIGMSLVPANLVVPAFVEIDVSLQVQTRNTLMTAEYLVRVRDDDDRLLHLDGDSLYQTSPALFEPAIMMN